MRLWQTIAVGSLILCTNPSLAYSQASTSQLSSSASFWWVPIVAALIGAISAIVTLILKDLVFPVWNEKRAKSNKQREIFRNYAAPLTTSSEKLIWRFQEIFVENRYQFLKTATLPLVYNEYKRKSTLYRVASLLGWIRAINLELSALPRGASGFLTPLSAAIAKLQSALADGPHVEVHRLKQLCTVWGLDINSVDEDQKRQLATRLEVKLYELAGNDLKHDSEHIKSKNGEEQTNLCRSLAEFLCKELRRTKLDDGVIEETVDQAIVAISYREALIYRDWQDAIGDSMLEIDSDSVRRFKIVGYQKFEDILESDSLWMNVFRGSINDIDFEFTDPNDFRAQQLKDVAAAVAGILISLSGTDDQDLVSKPALGVAKKLVGVP